MAKKVKCNHDCFNCIFPDCICDTFYSEKSLYKNRSEKAKAYQREYQKKKRQEAKEKGFCIICRQEIATRGTKCYECYIRQKRHDRAKCSGDREYWKENGLCYFCGQQPLVGKKVCEKHYKYLAKNIVLCNGSENTKKAQKEFVRLCWRKMSKKCKI